MVESGRKHGPFDFRYPAAQKSATSVWGGPRHGDAGDVLGWYVFSDRFVPNRNATTSRRSAATRPTATRLHTTRAEALARAARLADRSAAGEAHGDPRHRPPPGEAARNTPTPRRGDAHVLHLARTDAATCITILVRHVTRLSLPMTPGRTTIPRPAGFQTSDHGFHAVCGGILGS